MSAKKVAIVSATAVAVLAALYTAAGYLAVPAAVKWAVGKYLPEALDGKNATVESVSFNPWGLVLEVQNLKVESAKHPGTNVLSLGNLKADASISSLFKMAPILEQLSVKSLIVDYDQTPAGAKAKKTVTESSMVQGAAGAAKAAKSKGKSESKGFSIPALSLADVSLSDSSVRFRDASQGVDVQATEINFQLPLISTLASSTDLPEMTPKLSLKLDGNPISATGKTTKNGATITVNIPELDAARIIKALPVKLPVAVNSLHLSADVTADYSMAKGASNVLVSGKVHAANINVTQSSMQPTSTSRRARTSRLPPAPLMLILAKSMSSDKRRMLLPLRSPRPMPTEASSGFCRWLRSTRIRPRRCALPRAVFRRSERLMLRSRRAGTGRSAQ